MISLLAAAALLAGDVPLERRLEKLAPFFRPAPGETLAFDAAELRDFGKKISPKKLRGRITVTPPKGACFTIQRSPEDPDEVVCKQAALTFTYADLDRNGFLQWQVSTGDGDFGTRLTWRTPYRVAIVTPFDKSLDDPPEYRFIKTCEGMNDPEKGRRIVLKMVDGETWSIRFPEQDQLLDQPDPIPNLFMTHAQGKISVKQAAEQSKPKDAAPEGEGEAKAEAAAPAPAPAAATLPSEEEERAVWSMPRRGAYTMPASNFQPFGSVAPGMKGECRYNFRGPDEDPATGRLECHDVDGFKHVYLPLTCLGQIQGAR